jgi:membrane-associated phospholipid phosphatase
LRNVFRQNKIFILLHALFFCIAVSIIFCTDKLHLHLFFNDYVNSPFDIFFKYITYIGDGAFILSLVLIIPFFNAQKSLTILLCYGVSTGFTQSIKYFFFNDADRPSLTFEILHIPLKLVNGVDVNIHHSFPSGHTTAAFSLFFCLSFFSKSNLIKTTCFISALLVAFSRVYLSEHFFEDITAGSFIGVAFSFLVCYVLYQTKLIPNYNKLQKPIQKLF